MRFVFRRNNVLLVFNHRMSTNAKITASNKPIIQTYTFGRQQFECILNGGSIMDILDFDTENCLDCPFSKINGYVLGKCYTHKFPQMRGFKAMLVGIIQQYPNWDAIPELPDTPPAELLAVCANNYIRFGTYGEPTFIPMGWVEQIVAVCKNWTGYTHQWHKQPEYSKFFMASVHNGIEERIANDMGWRVFLIVKALTLDSNTLCPSDRENVTCQKCALCSGTTGKGQKGVKIKYH